MLYVIIRAEPRIREVEMSESIYSKELTDLLQELDIQPTQPEDENIYGEWGRPTIRKAEKKAKEKIPLLSRFMEKIIVEDTHWMWQGAAIRNYGAIMVDSKIQYAHRVSYELFKGEGPIPAGRKVHTCEIKFCVNPAHLSIAPPRKSKRREAYPQSSV